MLPYESVIPAGQKQPKNLPWISISECQKIVNYSCLISIQYTCNKHD